MYNILIDRSHVSRNLSLPSTSAKKQCLAIEQRSHSLSTRSIVWTPLSHFHLSRTVGPKLEAFTDEHARHNPRKQRRESGRTRAKTLPGPAKNAASVREPNVGLIGEGKAARVSQNQRKSALHVLRLEHSSFGVYQVSFMVG